MARRSAKTTKTTERSRIRLVPCRRDRHASPGEADPTMTTNRPPTTPRGPAREAKPQAWRVVGHGAARCADSRTPASQRRGELALRSQPCRSARLASTGSPTAETLTESGFPIASGFSLASDGAIPLANGEIIEPRTFEPPRQPTASSASASATRPATPSTITSTSGRSTSSKTAPCTARPPRSAVAGSADCRRCASSSRGSR